MQHRRLAIPMILVGSLGIAFTPAQAQATTASSAQSTTSQTASTATSKAAGLKTFSSAASKSVRLQKAAVARVAAATTTGTTIYATTGDPTCSAGAGTSANPYCKVQDAVNAASAGDTIDVEGSIGYFTVEAVTITTSDLTIVGTSTQSWIAHGSGVAITIDGATNVKISNMMLAGNQGDVAIENSSNITLDSDYLGGYGYGNHNGVTIDGSSSNVAITRSYVDTGGWQPNTNYSAISVASGAKNITVASDLIADSSIVATGVTGLDITGNTIQRSCASGIDIEGTTTGAYVENNVLEDSDPNLDYAMGGYQSICLKDGYTWAPDITVASGSTASTTADYNDFSVYGSDATDPYSWGGTAYTTLTGFQTATSQGAHDLNDSGSFGAVFLRSNESANIAATPSLSSSAVGTGNTSAPGELSTDFYGTSSYKSRGAIQPSTPNPNLNLSLGGGDITAFGVELDTTVGNYSSSTGALSVTINWGDGQTTTVSNNAAPTNDHSYAKLGTYTITVTASDGQGDYASNFVSGVQTAGSEFTAYGPTRILDTRRGLGAPQAPLVAKNTLKLQVTGAGITGNVIPSGITAVVLNVTVTQSTGGGYLKVYGDQDVLGDQVSLPGTSNLNFSTGQTVPNLVVVPVGKNGVVDFYYYSSTGATTQVLADVAGYFTQSNASTYVSINPARILDTRNAIGVPTVAKIPANGSITLTVGGSDSGKIPSTGVTAVAMNLTVTDGTKSGAITAYPTGQPLPDVSNVNYTPGAVVANMSVVSLGTGGKITFRNGGGGPVDLIADVSGYYTTASVTSGAAYLPLPQPVRILDTRQFTPPTPLSTNTFGYDLPITNSAGDTAFVFNATVTQTTGNGVLSLYPYNPNTPKAKPLSSNLNYFKGQTVPNLAFVSPGTVQDSSGAYDFGIYLSGQGTAQLVLDMFGVFESD